MESKLLAHLASAIREATHHPFVIRNQSPVVVGSINEAYRLDGDDGSRFFLKLNDARHHTMFVAEAKGLEAIAATNTIHVPRTIAYGIAGGQSFLVLEHLDLNPHGDEQLLGEQLAALHRSTFDRAYPDSLSSEEVNSRHSRTLPQFGFTIDNFIGTTPQPNGWKGRWIDFWREQRLGFQLRLSEQNGYSGNLQTLGERLLSALPAFFSGYEPTPSLLHGDLWGGNHAFLADGTPVIFDPAVYYGDRECDLAMTELFGGYSEVFYAAYRAAYPLDAGYLVRRELYNLYHILNHANLFGGGYARQAEQMMHKLLTAVI